MRGLRATLCAIVCAWSLFAPDAHAQPADTILLDGKIVQYGAAPAQALAVRDGRIAAVGRSSDIRALAGASTRVVDLAGRTVIPGLIDFHIHAIRAGLSFTTEVHWIGARTLAEAVNRIRVAGLNAPKGSWLIVAGGWTERQFAEGRRPTQAEIAAAAPDHHVYVQVLYSAILLSPGGAQALGIAKDPGLISRLSFETSSDGKPTGWISGDNRTISDVYNLLPRPSFEQQVAGTRAFFRALNGFGITGVLDPGGYNMPVSEYRALFQVWRDRALTVRVAYSLCAPRRGHEREDLQAMTEAMPMGFGDDYLRFNGIGENVVWGMYNNEKPTEDDRERLFRVLRWAAPRGLTATFHWHNDRSVHHLLDVLERINRETPVASLRWSIAHLNDASPDNLAAHEGDGHRLADAERVLLPRRGIRRAARGRGCAARAADTYCDETWAYDRRGHRRAPGDELQPIRVAAMDAGRQDRRRHADARTAGNPDPRGGAAPLHAGQRLVLVRRR